MRTKEQIAEQIKLLTELKPKIAQRTHFGDDNHAAIDAQIKVLEEQADEQRVWDLADEEGWPDHTRDSALEAAMWLNEEQDKLAEDPDGWLSIAKK
jgi:hypothetical protein